MLDPIFEAERPNFTERHMTNISIHAETQSSRFNSALSGLFMAAVLTITGFLSLAMFAG
jgi:Na+/proline symporter